MRIAIGLFAAVVVLIGARSLPPKMYHVQIDLKYKGQIDTLAKQGFDIAGVDLENNRFVILTDDAGLKQIENVHQITPISTTPVWQVLDSKYKTPDQVEKALKKFETDFPGLVTVYSLGKTTDGRDLYAARVTDRFSIPDKEKVTILFDAMHHAREVMTPEIALDIVDYLTSKATTDKQVKKWLRSAEIWVVPMVNPDGNDTVWNSNNMWRKNTRGGYGVDNNRNYPHMWNSCNGSSGDKGSETYRGPSAGSEPETQALMGLAQRIKPAINISYHSFSEIVIYPLGCPSEKLTGAQKTLVETVGKKLASLLPRDSGSGTYTPGTSYDLLYAVDGGSTDWMYAEAGALAFTIEVNAERQGFQPSFSSWRDSTVNKNRAGWQYMIERALGAAIRVEAPIGQKVRVETASGQFLGEKSTDDKGWAHFIVEPGSYKVSTPGSHSFSQNTVVGDKTVFLSFL